MSSSSKISLQGHEATCGIVTFLLIAGIVFFNTAFVEVDAGTVGILLRWGAVEEPPMEPGLHMIVPIMNSVYHMDTKIQPVSVDASAFSSNTQTVHSKVTLQYYVTISQSANMFEKVGNRESMKTSIIWPAMQESVKAVTAKWTAEELITKREVIKVQIKDEIVSFIDTTLESKNLKGGIQVANVAITNFDFSEQFNQAIELKVKAEQEALQAENEMNTTITRAQAEKFKMQLQADAEAYKIETMSVARTDAITREAAALADKPDLIKYEMVTHWDGKLPRITGANGSMLMDVNGIMAD